MDERIFKYCKIQKKVVPISEAMVEVKDSDLHHFILDDMPPTKHPVDGKYYTSKAKFRATTRAHGYVEIGDAYDRGYSPEKEYERDFKESMKRLKEEIRTRYRS